MSRLRGQLALALLALAAAPGMSPHGETPCGRCGSTATQRDPNGSHVCPSCGYAVYVDGPPAGRRR